MLDQMGTIVDDNHIENRKTTKDNSMNRTF